MTSKYKPIVSALKNYNLKFATNLLKVYIALNVLYRPWMCRIEHICWMMCLAWPKQASSTTAQQCHWPHTSQAKLSMFHGNLQRTNFSVLTIFWHLHQLTLSSEWVFLFFNNIDHLLACTPAYRKFRVSTFNFLITLTIFWHLHQLTLGSEWLFLFFNNNLLLFYLLLLPTGKRPLGRPK